MEDNKRTQLDIALDIMEILAQEGINVNDDLSLHTQKDVKTQTRKRFRLLKDMRIENIDEIIAKHDLDPNFKLGYYLSKMRSPSEYKTEVQQARIEKLGIISKAPEEKTKLFRNQLVEALYIMEELKKQGIDWPYVPQTIDGKMTTLGDIDVPGIKGILTKLSLNPDYPIGSRIREIHKSYSGEKVGYYFEGEEKKRTDELGIFNSAAENAEETLKILKAFAAEGIDLKIFNGKCLAEIKDENVLAIAEKLKLPKYYMIGNRISTMKRLVYDRKEIPETEYFKQEMIALGLMEEQISVHKVLEVMEGLEAKGINLVQIAYQRPKSEGLVTTQIKHLGMEDLDEFLREYDIGEDFPIGNGLNNISQIYKEGKYQESEKFSAEEKRIIKKFGIEKKKENEKHVVQDTIRLVERLIDFGIDVEKLTLKPYENGKQRSLELGELPLTEQQMQQLKEEFELDEKFQLGSRIINIRQAYKGKNRMKISPEERKEVVRVGIVPELLALDVEQKELESRLEEIKKLKRESANLTKGKNQPSIGE